MLSFHIFAPKYKEISEVPYLTSEYESGTAKTFSAQGNSLTYYENQEAIKEIKTACCTKVIMSGVNDKVIMSGCGDDNPDDERREAARDNTKSV